MLNEWQEKYLQEIPANEIFKIIPFNPEVNNILKEIKDQIRELGINLEVAFMGTLALGISGRGDIDLYIYCPEKDFSIYLPELEKVFGPWVLGNHRIKWEFRRNGYEIDMRLVDPNTLNMQNTIKSFEMLKNNKELLGEYETLKKSANGKPLREYVKLKMEFFNRILQ